MSRLTWGAVTDRGLQRAINEDAMLADPPLFVVADGMGGHAAGDVASRIAIDSLVDLVGREPIGAQDVLEAVAAANRAIVEIASSNVEQSGMGTTLTGLAKITAGGQEHWMVFNLGDSRVYRLIEGTFSQLTVDHSEAQELIAVGRITEEEARTYRRRHVVTRSLGVEPAEPLDSWVFPIAAEERFLVCSDGLTGEVEDDEIRACLENHRDPQEAAQALVNRAIEAGGRDNVTVLVVDGACPGVHDTVEHDTMPRGLRAS